MSDLLSIGASGVLAYQSALTTTSENIANAGTEGYTRRAVRLNEISSVGGGLTPRRTGSGVAATTILRNADDLKSAAVRESGSDLARTTASIDWLAQIEDALDGNQLGDRLTSFFNSAKAIAADPTATVPRSNFLEAGASVATAFVNTGNTLDQIAASLDATAESAVTSINDLGNALARVNDGLGRTQPGSSAAAQLLDRRDAVLEQLSTLTAITVTNDDLGRATVTLGSNTGPTFVSGVDAGYLTYVGNGAGAVSFAVHRGGTIASVPATNGVLGGIVEGAQRIAAAASEVDRIATDFVTALNGVQAAGRDLNGNPGQPLFAVGATPTDVSLALGDPRGVAAAAVGGGPRDNRNLVALESLRASGGFESANTALVASNAATLAARRAVSEAQTSIHEGAITARDTISGVNLDKEAVDLLRFQQAYAASSRVIQVARDTFQSILDIR